MASADHPSARWLSRLRRGGQPVYLAVVQALEAAIRTGELQAGADRRGGVEGGGHHEHPIQCIDCMHTIYM